MVETNRRRKLQQEYNEVHGIQPETIYKTMEEIIKTTAVADAKSGNDEMPILNTIAKMDQSTVVEELKQAMYEAASNLEFEKAAALRDQINQLESQPVK